MSARERIYHFFEDSKSPSATAVRIFISILIVMSAGVALIQTIDSTAFGGYATEILYMEYFILAVFTAEYLIRFITSPNKLKFVVNKYNVIDILAIVPFYFGLHSLVYVRIFRLFRIFRFFKLLKIYGAFRFRGTILEKITPLVIGLVSLKAMIIWMERSGYWLTIENLGVLFTIIGFALGVILSQKIGSTYGKFLQLEDSLFTLQGKLSSLVFNINSMRKGYGTKVVARWIEDFLKIFRGDDKRCLRLLSDSNESLYNDVKRLGNSELMPHHRISAFMKEIFADASFIIGRKAAYTPKAYDNLLHQVLLIYLILIVIFLPGLNGIISIVIGTYLLYGMYYVTQDFDMAIGDRKTSLIKLEPSRMESFLKELKKSAR